MEKHYSTLKELNAAFDTATTEEQKDAIRVSYKKFEKEVEAKGLTMSEDEFHCRGAFKFVHRGRPNEEDLKNAQEFAKRIIV